MPPKKGQKIEYFGKVKQARAALKERANEILDQYLDVIREARAAGDLELAAESLRYLMDHMPDEDGETMIGGSVDRKQQITEQASTGPNIKIGIALGGIDHSQQRALPAISVVKDEDGDS